jgi:hypothetical protein
LKGKGDTIISEKCQYSYNPYNGRLYAVCFFTVKATSATVSLSLKYHFGYIFFTKYLHFPERIWILSPSTQIQNVGRAWNWLNYKMLFAVFLDA